MKLLTGLALVCVMAVPLMGAKCSGTAQAEAECKPGSGCTKSAKVSGTWEFKQANSTGTTLDVFALTGTAFDAALWSVALNGSNVTVPAYGTALLKMVDSSTGSTQAARHFGWYREGSVLRLSDPDAVNAWAIDNAGTADTVSYETAPFMTSENVGSNTLAMTDRYGTEQMAFARYSWRSTDRCPKRLDRHGNQIVYCP